jgi:hypothetical protein
MEDESRSSPGIEPRSSKMRAFVVATAALLVTTLSIGCEDGGTGTLSAEITDAPFPATADCLDAALVTIDGVSAKTGDGFADVALVDPDPDGTVTIDLLELRAGVTDRLAVGELETGELSEIRLHVVESVLVFSDESPDVDFKIPSAQASGLKVKIDPPALILAGQTTELIFDVDLGNSFKTRGLGGDPTCDELKLGNNVIFSPVIRVNNVATDGIVLGTVMDDTDTGVGDVEVCAFMADTDIVAEPEPVACTFSAPEDLTEVFVGDYALLLPADTYDLYVREQDDADKALVLEDVSVNAGERLEGQDLVLP